MIDIENLKRYTIRRPDEWTMIGTPKEYDELPESHKDQLLFLEKSACNYITDLASVAGLTTGYSWDPFAKGNFKSVETFTDFTSFPESKQHLKKWLYERGIPFSNWVFVLTPVSYSILATWKMVIKYSDSLFCLDDSMVFDRTFNWCMIFFHHSEMFFGRDNIYNPAEDYRRMEALNERKRKYPQFKHPFL